MKKSHVIIGIVALVLIIGLVWYVGARNNIIGLDEKAETAWHDIDVQLQRRADLIPNLVTVTQKYATHEKDVFTAIANARARLLSANGVQEKAEASEELNSAIGRLLVVAENYPQLKADQGFIRLQDELAGTENRIAVVRKRYNDTVNAYNTAIRQFPGSLVAPAGSQKREYFEPPQGHKAIELAPVIE